MIEKINNREEFRGKEWLDRYLIILENSCSDFADVKSNYENACTELRKKFKYIDRIIEYTNDMLLSNLKFSFNQGFKANVEHFANPQSPTFLDTDYDAALKEKEMLSEQEYVEASTERQKWMDLLPAEASDVYDVIVEYNAFLDTYIPKMAHYYGFLSANNVFQKSLKDYKPDYELINKYKEWLSVYLDLNLE